MRTHLIRWLAAAIVALVLVGAQAQHFDEPSVMNQPYTQQVQDGYFGDYEGTYAPSEAKAEEGGPAPLKAEAKVVPQGERSYRIVLRAQPRDPAEWPLQIELPGRLEGERIRVFGSMGGHEWEGEIAKKTLRINKRGYGGIFEMRQVSKKAPSEGLKPPAGAIVLVA